MPEGADFGMERGHPAHRGRPQLKPAPFNKMLVGSYVFLAGLSGGAQLLAGLFDLTRGRSAAATTRRARYLSMLAPVAGTGLLISDLHTPQRFYNMLRVFKRTSPMSFGSWLLVAFGVASTVGAAAQFLADRIPGFAWLHRVARAAELPGGAAGAGLATYTASLFAATSTPSWAAAPASLGVRFGASSIASAAAALRLAEGRTKTAAVLEEITVGALAAELTAVLGEEETYRRRGLSDVIEGPAGQLDRIGGTALGAALPLGMLLGSRLLAGQRATALSGLAAVAVLAGGLAMRVGVIGAGEESARRRDVSLHFAGSDASRQPAQPG